MWFDPALSVTYRPRGSLRSSPCSTSSTDNGSAEVLRRYPRSLRARQALPPLACVAVATGVLLAPLRRRLALLPAAYRGDRRRRLDRRSPESRLAYPGLARGRVPDDPFLVVAGTAPRRAVDVAIRSLTWQFRPAALRSPRCQQATAAAAGHPDEPAPPAPQAGGRRAHNRTATRRPCSPRWIAHYGGQVGVENLRRVRRQQRGRLDERPPVHRAPAASTAQAAATSRSAG